MKVVSRSVDLLRRVDVADALLRVRGVVARECATFAEPGPVAIASVAFSGTVRAFKPAAQSYHRICYGISGSGTCRIGRPGSRPGGAGRAGMAAVIPAAEASEWLTEGSHETVDFYLAAGLVREVASEIYGPGADAVRIQDAAFHFDEALARYAMAARERLRDPEPVAGVELEAVANLLAAHVLRRYSNLSCRAALRVDCPLSPAGLDAVTEHILAHLDSALTLRELAAVAGMNPYRFARAFHAATGESPHKYIVRRRIGNAQALLAASDLPLSRIAAAVGFSSQSHMTLAFQRTLAITPGRFRHETGRKYGNKAARPQAAGAAR